MRWAEVDSDEEQDSPCAAARGRKLSMESLKEALNGTSTRRSWADIQSEDEHEEEQRVANTSNGIEVPGDRPRWADIQSDEEQVETIEAVKADAKEGRKVEASARKPKQQVGKKTWVELPSDEADKQSWKPKQQKPAKPSNTEKYVEASKSYARGAWDRSAESTKQEGKRNRHKGADNKKFQCQFIIGIEEEPKFRVVRKIVGPGGQNMKTIAEQTGAKMRLRGRGSKFLEGPEKKESSDPLMLCLSVTGRWAYETSAQQISQLLEKVYSEYRQFCHKSEIGRAHV